MKKISKREIPIHSLKQVENRSKSHGRAYSDNSGKELSGAEIMALKLFKIATNEKDKQCISAIKLIIELTGQNKDTLTDKKTKAEIKLLEARIKALSGLDETESKKLLDNINKILSDVDSVIE